MSNFLHTAHVPKKINITIRCAKKHSLKILFYCFQFSYFGHGLFIWFFLRIRPVNDDVTAPNFHATCSEPPLSQRSWFVGLILQEAEASVLLFVIRRTVDYHLCQASYGRKNKKANVSTSLKPLRSQNLDLHKKKKYFQNK